MPVRIEVAVRRGTPGIHASGLPAASARATAERVRAAAAALGRRIPGLRVTVNLAPADLPKDGAAFDLPIAAAILARRGADVDRRLARTALVGELGLSGVVRPVRGVLAFALHAAGDAGIDTLVVPRAGLSELAGLHEGRLRIFGASDLGAVLSWLEEGAPLARPPRAPPPAPATNHPDLSDVRGQSAARRALEIAAAGGHHLLLSGEPGAGKTMLANRLPGLLPPLTAAEAVETMMVHGIASGAAAGEAARVARPFRAPHHTVTAAGLLGGGSSPAPGEVSLAHRGVLFLDELQAFRASVLEGLRAPLEQGCVRIVRARTVASFPARFQLVAAMNPCPCGYRTSGTGRCVCDEGAVRRYVGRISGPLLDRFDLRLEVPAVPWRDMRPGADGGERTAAVRDRVRNARERARRRAARLSSAGACAALCNAELPGPALAEACRLTAGAEALLGEAAERLPLGGRAQHRVLRVARTVADLAGSGRVEAGHVAEALHFRGGAPVVGG
ncbi:MAG: YifB family Mg chelatase-like AAA ATPase [Gemmatimonadota bacterium]|nr:YifB family Mg chelatase-like AAA ATPase [Gemmatimonadota bacterium]